MDSRSLAILIPSAHRPRRLAQCLASLLCSDLKRPLTVVVSLVQDDVDSLLITDLYPMVQVLIRTIEEYVRGAVYGWNSCLRHATGYDLYVLGADDLLFEQGWLSAAINELDRLPESSGVVGFNDLASDGTVYAAHWLADRRFLIEHMGGVMYPPMYRSWWCDREISDIAMALKRYAWAKAAIVEHMNYGFGKSPFDRTYRDAAENYEADRQLYNQRKALGFPRTWKAILEESG